MKDKKFLIIIDIWENFFVIKWLTSEEMGFPLMGSAVSRERVWHWHGTVAHRGNTVSSMCLCVWWNEKVGLRPASLDLFIEQGGKAPLDEFFEPPELKILKS